MSPSLSSKPTTRSFFSDEAEGTSEPQEISLLAYLAEAFSRAASSAPWPVARGWRASSSPSGSTTSATGEPLIWYWLASFWVPLT